MCRTSSSARYQARTASSTAASGWCARRGRSTFRSPYQSNIRKVSDLLSIHRDALANAAFVADKVEFSCLRSELLRERLHGLRREGRPQVVLAGIEAHVCVLQTAIDLEAQGFEAFVVADATGSRSKGSRSSR